jgi:hypothetical protein
MNNSQISRLSVVAAIAASLLAVGVVTAISMTEKADAQISVDIRNRISQSNSATTTQTATASSSGTGSSTASNTATTTQSNTATQTNTNR